MLRIDIGGDPALFLDFGHHMEGERRLAGGFRPINLNHAAPRQPANAERDIEPERTGGNRIGIHRLLALPQLHHRALAEGPVDLGERRLERALLVAVLFPHHPKNRLCHESSPLISQRFRNAQAPQIHALGASSRRQCTCFVLFGKPMANIFCRIGLFRTCSGYVPAYRAAAARWIAISLAVPLSTSIRPGPGAQNVLASGRKRQKSAKVQILKAPRRRGERRHQLTPPLAGWGSPSTLSPAHVRPFRDRRIAASTTRFPRRRQRACRCAARDWR